MRMLTCLLVLLSLQSKVAFGQTCFRDGSCFFTTNGTFDTLYVGTSQSHQIDSLYFRENWQKKYQSLYKRYAANNVSDLQKKFINSWRRAFKKSPKKFSLNNLNTLDFTSLFDPVVDIELIVELENCSYINSRSSLDDNILFKDPGYLIFYNYDESLCISYQTKKKHKESSILKIAIFDRLIKIQSKSLAD